MQVHIPKCAGTSVSHWLRVAAETRLTTGFGAFYPDTDLTEDALWEAGLCDPRVTTASAHNVGVFIPTVHGRRMHYFTLTREPRAQMQSALRYMLQERVAFGVPDTVGRNTFDIARWNFARPIGEPFRENPQTNHLALFGWCAATAGRCDPHAMWTWTQHDRAVYLRERLSVAKAALDGFLVTGTVERLSESMTLLRERSLPIGITLPPASAIGRDNVTRPAPGDDFAWLENSRTGQRLCESIAVDEELYAYANGLLDALSGVREEASRPRYAN
jgi:hypothetical protein